MGKINFKRVNPASFAPTPTGSNTPIVHEDSKETQRIVENEILRLNAEEALVNHVIDNQPPNPQTYSVKERALNSTSLTSLIDEDFPFDDSQLAAINGIAAHRFACLTGAAGTGKTTVTKAIVERIQHDVGLVDMREYFKTAKEGTSEYDEMMDRRRAMEDPDDEYEMPENAIPSICLLGFTGRSTQQIKRNFPRDWHGNIMTIHRCLAYMPETFEVWNEETQDFKNSMRFVPTYTAENKLPWNTVIIDEAGMLGLDLWHNLFAAMRPGTRVIMIGDINQLPPVHGRSIFGFALGTWPSWELTTVHRQEGVNNSIVDNAWNIINGKKPVSDIPDLTIVTKPGIVDTMNKLLFDKTWKSVMVKVPEDSREAAIRIRQFMGVAKGRLYDPIIDSLITATNGENETSNGAILGQLPMNQELAILLNKTDERYIIDAGREKRRFAVGDKVMATKNDHDAGITNGMTGIITDIEPHQGYAGDFRRFGLVSEVTAYMAELGDDDTSDVVIDMDELMSTLAAQEEAAGKAKEKKDRGPSSHIVTVRFGDGDHSFEMPFDTLAAVGSLMTAYAVTCHKMQGGESPMVMTICHNHHRAMLYREWLYTAQTRARERAILFYTDLGLSIALSKQRIKGKTMLEKVKSFQELQRSNKVGELDFGPSVTVRLQEPEYMDGTPWTRSQDLTLVGAAGHQEIERVVVSPSLQALVDKAQKREAPETSPIPQTEPVPFSVHVERVIVREIVLEAVNQPAQYTDMQVQPAKPVVVDGGELRPEAADYRDNHAQRVSALAAKLQSKLAPTAPVPRMLPKPAPTHTPEQLMELERNWRSSFQPSAKLLTHFRPQLEPAPAPAPEPVSAPVKVLKYRGLAELLRKGK
jgi:hypothetical protein